MALGGHQLIDDASMDVCANLTLHVARFLQMPAEQPSSPVRWTFIPDGRQASWIEAADFLTSLPKPLIVAPLLEAGLLGIWIVDRLPELERKSAEYQVANQCAFVENQLEQLAVSGGAGILFETDADRIVLAAPDFRRWIREYSVLAGSRLGQGPDASCPARLLVRRAAGQWSPGAACGPRRPAT
jgi:hypothetical protein